MAFGIIIIFACIILFVLGIFAMLSNLDAKNPTKSLPPVKPEKTIAEMLKEALASPPLGCMWVVKDIVKHQRVLANGTKIFDGSVDKHFAQITLMTPHGEGKSFSLMVDDKNFEHSLKFNVEAVLSRYRHQLESKEKKNETGWDGVYH